MPILKPCEPETSSAGMKVKNPSGLRIEYVPDGIAWKFGPWFTRNSGGCQASFTQRVTCA